MVSRNYERGVYGRVIPDVPHLPPSPQSPEAYFDWEPLVLAHRLQVMAETYGEESDPGVREARDREAKRCRQSRAYMLCVYGSIYEARPPEEEGFDDGEEPMGALIPFIPYPFQLYVIDNYYTSRRTKGNQGDILNVKARDMGLSNLYGFLVAGDWACEPVFSARVASRVEDLVDEIGNPDSLFWKIEMFLKGLPAWLMSRLVPGFQWSKHRKVLSFRNPNNANSIIGESTQANAGRGGRATVIIYDEAAFMPNFGAIWMAGRSSTRHRIAISTVSTDEGMDFHNLHKGVGGYTRPNVVELHWDEHPLHDLVWLEQEKARDTPEGIAREVFMDYNAGNTGWIYPDSHHISPGYYPFEPGAGHLYTTMDDGFDDDFAMIRIQYIRATGRFRIFSAYKNSHQVTDYYGSMLKGVPESQFHYDAEAVKWMERQRQLPPQTYTIDVHFDNVEQMTGISPYERLIEKYGIVCHMEMNRNNRLHLNRWKALGRLLPLMDFHEADNAVEVLEAIQRYRLKQQRAGSENSVEQKIPIHDRDSHYVTAMEWFALAWDSIRYNSDQTGQAAALPPDHNSAEGANHGHVHSTGTAESRDDGCPRGFAPCVFRSARGCSACGLGRSE